MNKRYVNVHTTVKSKKRSAVCLSIIMLFICIFSFVACGDTEEPKESENGAVGELYTDEELGISFEFPDGWAGNYGVERLEGGGIEVYQDIDGEKVALLFSITRQPGELIDTDDINLGPPTEIILVGNGWTYILTRPGDVQVPSGYGEEYIEIYERMANEISDLAKTVELSGGVAPVAENEGFKVVGTGHFTMEVPEDWDLERNGAMIWSMTADGEQIGDVRLASYGSDEKNDYGYETPVLKARYPGEGICIDVTFFSDNGKIDEEELKELGQTAFDSLVATGGQYTIYHLESLAYTYQQYGAEVIYGTIESFEADGGLQKEVTVRTKDGVRTLDVYSTQPTVAPRLPGGYDKPVGDMMDINSFAAEFAKGNYTDRTFQFTVNANGVQVILGMEEGV